MCGIVGLYLKSPNLQASLGEMFAPMLMEMTNRGPDSAGFAVYRDAVGKGSIKLTLAHDEETFDWEGLAKAVKTGIGAAVTLKQIGNQPLPAGDRAKPKLFYRPHVVRDRFSRSPRPF
jgi:amidophosphoribosyltransferase